MRKIPGAMLFAAAASASGTGALITAKDKSGELVKNVSVWLEPDRLQVSFNVEHGYCLYEKLNPDSYTVVAYSFFARG